MSFITLLFRITIMVSTGIYKYTDILKMKEGLRSKYQNFNLDLYQEKNHKINYILGPIKFLHIYF